MASTLLTSDALPILGFHAPPGLDAPAVPRLPLLLTSLCGASADTQCTDSLKDIRRQSRKKQVAPTFCRAPPGLEHFQEECLAVKSNLPHTGVLIRSGTEEAADVCTIDTAPPSARETADSCDGFASEYSDTPRGGTEHIATRPVNSHSPDHLLIQESGGVETLGVLDGKAQVLSIYTALCDEVLPSDVGVPGQHSVGSVCHHMGLCRPCDFVYRDGGCRSGTACQFCHVCGPAERKQRKKTRSQVKKFMSTYRR